MGGSPITATRAWWPGSTPGDGVPLPGGLTGNDLDEQEKQIKFDPMPADPVVFHNVVDITDVIRGPAVEGRATTADRPGDSDGKPR